MDSSQASRPALSLEKIKADNFTLAQRPAPVAISFSGRIRTTLVEWPDPHQDPWLEMPLVSSVVNRDIFLRAVLKGTLPMVHENRLTGAAEGAEVVVVDAVGAVALAKESEK